VPAMPIKKIFAHDFEKDFHGQQSIGKQVCYI